MLWTWKRADLIRLFTATVVLKLMTTIVPPADGYRVLAVETLPGKSHWNFMSAVLRALTEAGYEVTVFTPFPDGNRDNYTEVDTSGDGFPMKLDQDVLYMLDTFGPAVAMLGAWSPYCRAYCDAVHRNDQLVDLMAGGKNAGFDVIIAEPLVVDCVSRLATTLNAPIVYTIPSAMYSQVERVFTGHFLNPASVSHFLSHQALPRTFAQRFANTLLLAYSVLLTACQEWTTKLTDPRPYNQVTTVIPSIIFQNTHYITEAARPVTANLVDVGGIHLKPPNDVPKDLLEFIENSPHGIIVFSFGSTVNMSTLPDHVKNAFKKALSRVPQRVLWRHGGEMKDKPENVMIKKWLPQRDLLLHPNIKLFISHGGISGLYEAVDAGVPVLGFPLFYDQPRNIAHLVHNGMAISLELLSVTEDTVLSTIEELINNDRYKKNAMIASERFKDRPLSPHQSVVYWTEYAVRHKGAPHLKSQALNLAWYQYFLLDVIAVILLFMLLTIFVCYKLFNVIYKCTLKFRNNTKMKFQ